MSTIAIFLGIGLCVGAIARMTLRMREELARIRELEASRTAWPPRQSTLAA
jgi:hypothetical protein